MLSFEFPGMLDSLHCMHYKMEKLSNCREERQYDGRSGYPTIILEVVADYGI